MINNASWDKNCCLPHKYQTEQNIIFTYCIFYDQSCLFNILFVLVLPYIKLPCGVEEIATDKKIRNPPYFFVAIYICVLYRLSIYYQLTKSYFRSVHIPKDLYTKSQNSFILIYRPCSQYFNVVHEIIYQQWNIIKLIFYYVFNLRQLIATRKLCFCDVTQFPLNHISIHLLKWS